MLVKTDLRARPTDAAINISYDPTAPLTAQNVQTAIEQTVAQVALPGGAFPKTVTFAMSPYTPLITDSVLDVDTTGGIVVIQMPLSAARLTLKGYVPLTVKDAVGNSAVNAIDIQRAGAELIDGRTNYPVDSPYTAVTLQPKAVGYDVV